MVGGGGSNGSNGGNSTVTYGGFSSIANGGSSANGTSSGNGGTGNIFSATFCFDGDNGLAGNFNISNLRYGGVNGFVNGRYKHAGIEYQNYGRGGDSSDNPYGDLGYYNGDSGYVRIYFCVN